MGSCASVHHKDAGFPKKVFLASPPPKEKALNGKGGAPVDGGHVGPETRKGEVEQEKPPGGLAACKSPDSGSKDEMFYESRGWLDSDCEDDFHSVNGDFTPSRGNTPNYQPGTQTVMSNIFLPDNVQSSKSSETSPTGRRKLADLLQEATQHGSEENKDTTAAPDTSKDEKQQLKKSVSADGKPVSESSSACSTDPTPMREAKSRKEKAWYTGRCCLPNFVYSLTLDERRQKMSPGPCAV